MSFCFFFPQGDMEQALENYDVCTEMLQSSAAAQAKMGNSQNTVIRLPNLHGDSVLSLEEVRHILMITFMSCFSSWNSRWQRHTWDYLKVSHSDTNMLSFSKMAESRAFRPAPRMVLLCCCLRKVTILQGFYLPDCMVDYSRNKCYLCFWFFFLISTLA